MSIPQNRYSLGISNIPLKQKNSHSNQEWQSFCIQIKKTMSGTDEQKENILRKRLLKFFHNFSIQKNRYYVQRRQIYLNACSPMQISNNSILLYGIDFLPEYKIQQYFRPFQVAIEYYDDSHCSVCFQNYDKLMNAVYPHLEKKTLIFKDYQSFYQKITLGDQNKFVWMELEPYYELCFERVLWFRFLTSRDFQNKKQTGQSAIHQTYSIAKNNFFKEIQKSQEKNECQRYSKRSNSRQKWYSRQKEQGQDERSRSREKRTNYNSFFNDNQRCKCSRNKNCVSVPEIIDLQQRNFEKNQSQLDHQSENCGHHNIKKTSNKGKKIIFQQKLIVNRPIQRLEDIHNKNVLYPQNKNLNCKQSRKSKREASRTVDENLDQHQDTMIKSLVKELEKYNFDEQDQKFEMHLKQMANTKRQSEIHSNRKGPKIVDIDEQSIFETIQEQ